MELVYTLKGLDCPHCSEKIERDVAAMEQVSAAAVNLAAQTLTVHTGHTVPEELHSMIEQIVHKHEPEVEVVAHPHDHDDDHEHEHDHCCDHDHEHEHEHTKEHAHTENAIILTLRGLDCPHCAAQIEHDTEAIAEVEEATVNLVQQTLTVFTDSADRAGIIAAVTAIVHKHEPDVEVTVQQAEAETLARTAKDDRHADRIMTVRLIAGGAVFLAGIAAEYLLHLPETAVLIFMVIAYVILGWDVVWKALRNITIGQIFDEHFLMSISTVGAFVLGDYPEAAAVMLFYQIGEFFQSLAVQRSRRSIASLLDIRPDTANVLRGGTVTEVPAEQVQVGEQILVRAGERIPLDGTVTEGDSMLDTVALTGESVPRHVKPGDAALSGCINQNGTLTVTVTKPFRESTASKIIDMVENASARKAPTENFITTFARYYTPVVVGLAVLLAVLPPLLTGGAWSEWIRRAFVFLIVSCPCALVLSIPLTFFSGIGAASRCGVLVKGSNDLEALSKVTQLVFDKTGTLTKGVFRVSATIPADGRTEEELLLLAAYSEQNSNHPIAVSILAAFDGALNAAEVTACEEISGRGIRAEIGGKTVLTGSAKLMREHSIDFAENDTPGTKVYVAADGSYVGCILIADEIKADAAETVSSLRREGIGKTVMLTGDDRSVAEAVAKELKLDACYAQLLPEEKVSRLEELLRELPAGEKLAFVGDGINDAPVLARADVGIAMGALGADAAIEAADVVLMTDEPARLSDAIAVAKQTKRIVMQNIVFAIGVKVLLLILGALGIVGMWWAVFGDVGVTLIAVLNALRALKASPTDSE